MKFLFKLVLAATTLFMLAACSSTGDTVASNATGEPAEIHDPDKVTCRTKVKTGTRIGTKTCKTNRAWAESSRRAREYADRISRTGGHTQTIDGN